MKALTQHAASAMALAGMLAAGSASAVVSQLPVTGTSTGVPPNLVLTMDDSSSMKFECFPDAMCTDSPNQIYIAATVHALNSVRNAYVTYDPSSLFARQMRSAKNPLYYNPAVRYRPWARADGTRLPEYPASAVPFGFSPRDLTTDYTFKYRFCRDLPSCVDQEQTTETFHPAQYYRLAPGTDGTQLDHFTQVLIKPEVTTYPKAAARDDCQGSTCTYAEEVQNFANWVVYASDRLQVAIGGTAEAFLSVPSSYRIAYGSLANQATNIDGVSNNTIRRGVRPFSGAAKDEFYEFLYTLWTQPFGTPLRRAMDNVGQYFSRQDNKSPWADDPATGQPVENQASCRRAFHVLMTDGMWNTTAAPTAGARADVDSTPGPEIVHADGTTTWRYQPAAPYAGEGASTLSDVAMYYWNRDLQPGLANDLKPNPRNPAFWQHMVNYVLAFGVDGLLRNPQDLPALEAGEKSWGTPGEAGKIENIDDLWHAAINSRGLSMSAASSTEYDAAMKSIVQDIIGRRANEAGISVSSRSYSANARKYVPSYETVGWTGDVEAVQLNDGTTVWRASEKIPAPAQRKIYTFNTNGTQAQGLPFTFADLESAQMTSLLGVDDASGLIGYVRGDRAGEGYAYRARDSLLGDIVNSSPVLVGGLVELQYDFLPSDAPGRSSYLQFVANKKRRTPQLFVGANDGMLHAFSDGETNGGTETFAFVPSAVLGQLKHFADPGYTHRYFVDGPLLETDVYDKNGAKWRSLVVGGGGAGARNLFAVNVPVPASGGPNLTDAQSAPGASDILWEVSSDHDKFSELGHVLRPPAAGMLRDGQWAVFSGNGYDSASGSAMLYVIDAISGERIAVFDTGAGSAQAPNGLGGVALVRDAMMRVVAAYAGDLEGNLWKFDLSSTTSADWTVAFQGKPLFRAVNSAGEPEPITAAPAYAPHPLGGVMVLAGTGKLFEEDDPAVQDERTLYGVWDKVAIGTPSSNEAAALTDNESLVTQKMVQATTPESEVVFFSVTNEAVDYGAGPDAGKRGWRLAMTGSPGQRVIHDARAESGRAIFDAMTPGGVAKSCSASGPLGAIFVLDLFTGGPGQDGPTFDTNGDGVIDGADDPTVAVVETSDSGPTRWLREPGSDSDGKFAGPDDETQAHLGRIAVKRQWRQIFTPPSY